jgi:5'(3')-deoxyribonucleotidase
MDDVLCDYTVAHKRDLAKNPDIKFPQSQYGFYTNLKPIENAIRVVKRLIMSEKFDVYILTAPSFRNPLSYTEKRVWIETQFGIEFTEKLIICSNKGLLRGDILIDDNNHGKGQENFIGRLIQFGSAAYPDWNSIEKVLL